MQKEVQKLRVGIAGYGVVGKRRDHFIRLNPNLQTVAVCDRMFDGDGRLENGARYYTNYQTLLEREKLDILFVCLTNDVAAEVTVAGLKRGLHVFCEKPPGRDVDDIAQVIKCERENPRLKLMYGFNHRYHDSVVQALNLVRSGELGRVINIKGVYGKSKIINFNQNDWRSRRSIAGGGILLDQGIHMVDLIRLFAGEMEQIHSFVSNDFWKHDVEDNAYALMRNKQGAVVFLHSSATQWRHRFNLDIALERGQIILSGILSGSKSYGAETITVSTKSDTDQGDPKEVRTLYNEDPSWQREIEYFTNAVLNDSRIESGSSVEAFKTMELVYKIYCADPVWRDRFELNATAKDFFLVPQPSGALLDLGDTGAVLGSQAGLQKESLTEKSHGILQGVNQ